MRRTTALSLVVGLATLPACMAKETTFDFGSESGETGDDPDADLFADEAGDPGSETGEPGDPGDPGAEPPGDGDGDGDGDDPDYEEEQGDGDVGEDEGEAGEAPVPVVYTLDVGQSPIEILEVDLETAETTPLCGLPDGPNYDSIAFDGEGVMHVRDNAADLEWTVDLCNCLVEPEQGWGTNGLAAFTAAPGGMLGVDKTANQVVVQPAGKQAVGLETLAIEIGDVGLASRGSTIRMVDTVSQTLSTVSPVTGELLDSTTVGYELETAGLAYHPLTQQLFACSGDTLLHLSDNGGVQELGTMGMHAPCSTMTSLEGGLACD